MNISSDTWTGAIIGAVLGSIVIPAVHFAVKYVTRWWRIKRPQNQLLEGVADQAEPVKIFVSDLGVPPGTPLVSVEPRKGIGTVGNISRVWPDVEGRGTAGVLNVLGQVDKTKNIHIVHRSEDFGEWNCNVIVIGAQSGKAYDFYKLMENVAYKMDGKEIYDAKSGEIVPREPSYGYGLILKTRNPYKTEGCRGIAILLGGFGTLGTGSTAYYFRENFRQLGREFGDDCFGIVVRAPISAGEQAAERVQGMDRRFSS